MAHPIPKSILFFLALAISSIAQSLFAQALPEAWVCVSGDCGQGSNGFNSIQQAVNAVRVGGIVHVAEGVYVESVLIQSSITLQGAGNDRVVVQGDTFSDCLTIYSSDVVIDGFTFRGGRNGLNGAMMNSSIRHCTIEDFALDGMHLLNSDFNLIEGNAIVGSGATSTGNGLFLQGSRNNSIVGNTLSGNAYNIYLAADNGRVSQRNIVDGNTLLDPRFWSIELLADAPGAKLNFNVFKTTSTNDRYIRNAMDAVVNAQYNWFGGENPPQSSDFSGGVDYSNYYATNMTVFMFPTIQYMKPGDELDVLVLGLVPAGTQVRGTTMTVGWNSSIAAFQGTPTQGSFYTQKLVSPQNEFFQFNPLLPTNSVTIDQSLMGGSTGAGNLTGIPYVGLFYILKFHGITTGVSNLSLSNVSVRDPNNIPIASTIV
ncbi:MAG: right-handed parallel beta-helix repeat-containing protein, partial [bacterium]